MIGNLGLMAWLLAESSCLRIASPDELCILLYTTAGRGPHVKSMTCFLHLLLCSKTANGQFISWPFLYYKWRTLVAKRGFVLYFPHDLPSIFTLFLPHILVSLLPSLLSYAFQSIFKTIRLNFSRHTYVIISLYKEFNNTS